MERFFIVLVVLLLYVISRVELEILTSNSKNASELLPKRCQLQPLRGQCTRKYVRFYYNPTKNECLKFFYSGCGGNGEIFRKQLECHNRCLKNIPIQPKVVANSVIGLQHRCENCSRHSHCVNGKCVCRSGFYGSGVTCKDINECSKSEWNRCHKKAYCLNTPGSYRCVCQVGYAGNGVVCTNSKEVCSQPFDEAYSWQCSRSWEIQYFYNRTSNLCQRFWYSGCFSRQNQNFFSDAKTCEEMCVETVAKVEATNKVSAAPKKPFIPNEICMDMFDKTLKLNCGGQKGVRYYYDSEAMRCVPFVFDVTCGYIAVSRNIFTFYSTCKKLCLPPLQPTEVDKIITAKIINSQKFDGDYTKMTKAHFKPYFAGKKEAKKSSKRDRCSQPFDDEYQHDCWGTNTWEKRYYYNATSNECILFWYAGCISQNNSNIFTTAEICKDFCLDKTNHSHSATAKSAFELKQNTRPHIDERCFEPFNASLKQNCNGFKDARSYYNQTSKRCEYFSFDLKCGHSPNTRNLFGYSDCETLCRSERTTVPTTTTTEQPRTLLTISTAVATTSNTPTVIPQFNNSEAIQKEILPMADECLEPFNQSLTGMCGNGEWKPRYYYDQKERSCRLFWWDNCNTISRNFFQELSVCQRKCEGLIARPCLETFDNAYNKSCRSDSYIKRWYFDHKTRKCELVYYGGCRSQSRNLFATESLCHDLCEIPGIIETEVRQTTLISYVLNTSKLVTVVPITNIVEKTIYAMPMTSLSMTNSTRANFGKSGALVHGQYPAELYKRNLRLSQTVTCNKKKIRGTADVKPSKHVDFWQKSYSFSISDACLEPFEEWLTCSCRQGQWERRFYYSKSQGKCRLYWYDGCKGSTRNDFSDLTTCHAKCEGIFPSFKTTVISRRMNNSKRNGTKNRYHYARHIKTRELGQDKQKPFENISVPLDVKYFDAVRKARDQLLQPTISSRVLGTKLLQTIVPVNELIANDSSIEVNGNITLMNEINYLEKIADNITLSNITTLSFNSTDEEAYYADENITATISIADECLEPFDESLKRSCGSSEWQTRYYYDNSINRCIMYWNDGCSSSSKNNFDDLASCEWKCKGKHSKPRSRSCLDVFDAGYLKKCWNGSYENRYYFNHKKKQCELFYYGGCSSSSENIFVTFEECKDLCETPGNELFRACYEPFDPDYEKSCSGDGNFRIQYYYDQYSKQCRMFWYGNCKRESENIFPTLATCLWICERRNLNKIPRNCIDKFDEHYADSCGLGVWREKWYFNHETGFCTSFWYDGCTSNSQNIFDSLDSCLWLCEKPDLEVISEKPQSDDFKCLDEKDQGHCNQKYPAFFYNKHTQKCEPFAYSGCGGNGNRFLSLKQCETTCSQFRHLSEPETGCHLPLSIGYGKARKGCQQYAGYRYYYNKQYGHCGKFWYFGCGGNANRFSTHSLCEQICQRTRNLLTVKRTKEPLACFLQIDEGKCQKGVSKNAVRWAYDSKSLICEMFKYSGCGGNDNRFATKYACDRHCKGLIKPISDQCAYYPDWGPCNQLRYMWFYNMTSGTCEQFLYGGCDGNPNKFNTFEECQTTCEVPLLEHDACMEPMDRGKGCPGKPHLETRWYYDADSKMCIGYHSEGCGKSGNDFESEKKCKEICGNRKDLHRQNTPFVPSFLNVSSLRTPNNSSLYKYANEKPNVERPMNMHSVLSGSSKSYFKTEGQWAYFEQCFTYRYNVSGMFTKLNIYICAMEKDGACQMQVKTDTDGNEKCEVLRPWLKGLHYYSWFFTVERRPAKSSDHKFRMQFPNETIASVIVLPLNDCHNAC